MKLLHLHMILSFALAFVGLATHAFVPALTPSSGRLSAVSVQNDDINVLWQDDDDNDNEDNNDKQEPSKTSLKSTRWDNLNPKIKARIVKSGQERAIVNKQKTEGVHSKKRRAYRVTC